MDLLKFVVSKHFGLGYFDKKTFFSLVVHNLRVKNCVLYRYFSRIHGLNTAPRESLAVKFYVIKPFGRESLHVARTFLRFR